MLIDVITTHVNKKIQILQQLVQIYSTLRVEVIAYAKLNPSTKNIENKM